MKYKSVIFDWDGTLAKTLHLWLKVYKIELEKIGYNYSDNIIAEDFFYDHLKTQEKYPDINIKKLIINVRASFAKNLSGLESYNNVYSTLDNLTSSGVKLVLVTSSPKSILDIGFQKLDLEKYFSHIITSDDITYHKPHPEPFMEIIKAAGLLHDSTIIIGDSNTDIYAAHEAGISSCLFLPDENEIFYDFNELKKSNPTYVIKDLKEFINILK